MKATEKYRKLCGARAEYGSKAEASREELATRQAKQKMLEEAALRAEVLGEPDARAKQAAAADNRLFTSRLQADIEKAKAAITILDGEISGLSAGVIDEIREKFSPEMERAYRVYLKAIRETAAAEQNIQRVVDAANEEAAAAGVRGHINLEPTGSVRIGIRDQVVMAERRAKLNGYDVG